MRAHERLTIRVILLLAILLAGGVAAHAEWNAASGTSFTYCLAAVTCSGDPVCLESGLVMGAGCWESCGQIPPEPGACIGMSVVLAEIGWYLASGGFAGGGGTFGDITPGDTQGDIHVEGRRLSDELFEVSGNFNSVGNVRAEIALIRYLGDPAALEGLRVDSVSQLVGLGLIDESDILFSTEFPLETIDFDYDVDVTGISDEHLVLFAVGEGKSVATPAMGFWGKVVVVALLLAFGTWLLMRRRASRG